MVIGMTLSVQPIDDGKKASVKIRVYPDEGPNRMTDLKIFEGTLDMPLINEFISVQTYLVKLLFMISVAMQEEVDAVGYTPPGELMLANFERK